MDDSTSTLYDLLGAEAGIRRLVNRFYDLMDSAPEATHVRAVHVGSLDEAREKLIMFLSGWSGGPPLYTDKFGHPRLRQRHAPFSIGMIERDEWLWCMSRALDESGIDPQTVAYMKSRFAEIADFMRNRPEGPTPIKL
jgi:hemoglobin